jgi:hypothetical protein
MPTPQLSVDEQAALLVRIASDPLYFATTCIWIKPDKSWNYEQFTPWPKQARLFDLFDTNRYVVLLKARQLGMTASALIYALWLAAVERNSHIALISKQRQETYKLIDKLRNMYVRLPEWLRQRFRLVTDQAGHLKFGNGSAFFTFASNKSAADGMTLRLCIVDEADLIPDLGRVLNGAMPAVAASGTMILLSKSNKDLPESQFKHIYRNAVDGKSEFVPVFLPWWSRPDRDQDFYDKEVRNNGSIDYIWENYPASVEEALAARQESKRIPLKWLEQCIPRTDANGLRQWPTPIPSPVLAGVPGLRMFYEVVPGRQYVIGVDLASGRGESPNLDDSAAVVLDRLSQEQVAVYSGKIEPTVMAGYVAILARYYNGAGVLVEQNGQWGGACITYLKCECSDVRLLKGPHGDIGFNTTTDTKIDLYQKLSDGARCGQYTINDKQTFEQLASVEGRTLEAPPGQHDDIAMAFGFAVWAAERPVRELDVGFVAVVPKPTGPDAARTVGDLSPDGLLSHDHFDGSARVRLTPDVLRLLQPGLKLKATVTFDPVAPALAEKQAVAVLALFGQSPPGSPAPDQAVMAKVRATLVKHGIKL